MRLVYSIVFLFLLLGCNPKTETVNKPFENVLEKSALFSLSSSGIRAINLGDSLISKQIAEQFPGYYLIEDLEQKENVRKLKLYHSEELEIEFRSNDKAIITGISIFSNNFTAFDSLKIGMNYQEIFKHKSKSKIKSFSYILSEQIDLVFYENTEENEFSLEEIYYHK